MQDALQARRAPCSRCHQAGTQAREVHQKLELAQPREIRARYTVTTHMSAGHFGKHYTPRAYKWPRSRYR